jgi:hypothetical protein
VVYDSAAILKRLDSRLTGEDTCGMGSYSKVGDEVAGGGVGRWGQAPSRKKRLRSQRIGVRGEAAERG